MDTLALVDAWEDGRLRNLIERPLVLLAAAAPDAREDWASLPIGRRDARLLGLREELFGTNLSASAACPECGETLEIAFQTRDIRVPESPPSDVLEVDQDGCQVRFRLPNSSDLRFVARNAPDCDPRSALLERCVIEATTGVPDLTPEVVDAIVARMGDADPQAVVDLSLQCPACEFSWSLPFDIATYLWGEVEDLVHRLFGEVHTLASSYGWSEREILAMSPLRRRIYLDMVEG